MIRRALMFLFTVGFVAPGVACAQGTCNDIAAAEKSTYGFRPPKLTDALRKAKSTEMDAFWDKVKAAGQPGVACLRSLLAKQTDGFAVFDESALLYSLDHSSDSRDAAAHAVANTDLADVQPANYVRMGLNLAQDGADIESIARNYLTARTDVTTYLPQHGAFKLDRAGGAMLLFAVLPTEKIDDALSKEVLSESADVRNAAAVVWSMNMTERSFKGLSALGAMNGFSENTRYQVRGVLTPFEVKTTPPKYTREQMLEKVAKFPDFDMDPSEDFEQENKALDNSVYATFTEADATTLREARRKFITGVSNEALENYTEMSRVLLNLINKLHLYAEYRKGTK